MSDDSNRWIWDRVYTKEEIEDNYERLKAGVELTIPLRVLKKHKNNCLNTATRIMRYHSDPEFREKCNKQSREWQRKNRKVKINDK